MLINAVIIILREVLEASLIIGVLLALAHLNLLSKTWCVKALILGGIGAVVYAENLVLISGFYEGLGQEIVNISLYVFIFFFVVIIIYSMRDKQYSHMTISAMLACVAMALIREGSEVIIYVQGFSMIPELFTPVLIGSSIGAGSGLSIGVIVYYLIVNLPFVYGVRLAFFILVLIAGGMVSQATQMLLQANLIMSQLPIWDTSKIVSEQSIVGQVLFAMMGYEATPTPLQVSLYVLSILLTSFLAASSLRHTKRMK